MTDQKGDRSPDEFNQKVAVEVEIKTPASESYENQKDPILEGSEVPKTGDAPAD